MPSIRLVPPAVNAWLWIVSGVLFAIYPIARPFSDERGLSGAGAFASPLWLVAHLCAVGAFTALLLAVTSTYATARTRPQAARIAWALHIVGACLILPFYGAEAFGLNALGKEAIRVGGTNAALLVGLSADVRGGVGLAVFLFGAVALAAGAVIGIGATSPMTFRRWGALVVAVAIVLLIPQFFLSQPLRVAHGMLYLTGTLIYAVALAREAARSASVTPADLRSAEAP